MFIEPNLNAGQRGWIEVICGSMFSGKTEELIRRLKRVKIANLKTAVFKPAIDNRFHEADIVSHDTNAISSTPVKSTAEILLLSQDAAVVGIDEAQFFDEALVDVCNQLALRGVRVIVAGLDMDYLGKPFGPMPNLLAIADYVTKLHAICVQCGNIATISYRKKPISGQIVVGEKDMYEPRCRVCYNLKDETM